MTFALMVLCMPVILLAQTKKLSGTVNDENGKPIPQVSISIKNKTVGTQTDESGRFTIEAATGATLVFSSVNHENQESVVGTSSTISIVLKGKSSDLGDVVVVGYATQKKVNLTGSVSSISAKELENRPTSNISSSLAGLASGVFVRQGSGDPRGDGASIKIRGLGTLSSTNVLILVDGIIGSMDGVNPNDVESISILKDAASASIYGAQAANGVILITTKSGVKKKPTLTYNSLFSSTNPSGLPTFINNSVKYMNLINESYINTGGVAQYTPATIQAFANAQAHPNDTTAFGIPNYAAYPNTDWAKAVINSRTLQSHNVSVSGGNENTTYLMSVGYLKNPGLIDNSGLEKYQFRFNLESKISDNITVGTKTFGSLQNLGLASTSNIFNYITQVSPMIYPFYNGRYATSSALGDPVASSQGLKAFSIGSLGSEQVTNLSSTLYAKIKLLKGLVLEPKFNYTAYFDEANTWGNPASSERWNLLTMTQTFAPTLPSALGTGNSFNKTWTYTLESVLRYNTTIAKNHELGALIGFNQYYNNSYSTGISMRGLIDPSVPAINTATTVASNPTGTASDWSFRSVFGRVNYNYKGTYLLEGNIRRDGSSRFGPNFRYGNFPSVSAGWVLTNEPFLQKLKDHNIQSIKIRSSLGQLGNTASGNYQWQATYGTVPYSFNGLTYNGVSQGQIANPDLHWETTNVADIGLDATIFKKFNLTIDWYRRFTKDILFSAPLDITVGTASAPVGNFAQVLNSGLEFTGRWQDKIGKVNFAISANLGYNYLNNVQQYKGPMIAGWVTDASGNKTYNSNIGAVSSGGSNRILEGHMINEYFLQTVYRGTATYTNSDGTVNPNGGPRDGMIRTPADLTWVTSMKTAGYSFAPVNTVGAGQLNYGDLIYADNNGDKVYGNANDAQFMSVSTTPKYIFGFNVNASWNNFSVNMLWAGAAGFKAYWNQNFYNSVTMIVAGQQSEKIANDHYYFDATNPSNPLNNINATYPRMKSSDNIDNVASDFWFYNAAYVRLKNLQLSYNISTKILGSHLNKFINKASIFLSGENLVTISNSPAPDPEVGATATGYPTMKQYAIGLNITF